MTVLKDFYQKYGSWIYSLGAVVILVSTGFADSLWNKIILGVGLIALLSDPAILIWQKGAQKNHLVSWGAGLAAILTYFVRSFITLPPGTDPRSSFVERIRLVLFILFLASIVFSLSYRIALGLAHSSRGGGSSEVHTRRISFMKNALYSFFIAFAMLVLVNYLGYVRNPSFDLTPGYYSFSEESRSVIRSIPGDVEVFAFLPVQQAVRGDHQYTLPELYRIAEDVRIMLEQLPGVNPGIKLYFHNAELEADRVGEFSRVTNGTIIFRSYLPADQVSADDKPYVERRIYVKKEKDLDRLEKEAVRAMVQVSSQEKKIYFTALNGERHTYTDQSLRPMGTKALESELRYYNFESAVLDEKKGWPGSIPEDADVVAITGPDIPFSETAKETILSYLKNGGSLFVAVNPDGKESMAWLLEATDSDYEIKSGLAMGNLPGAQNVIVTDGTATHRITDNLRLSGRSSLVFPFTGVLSKKKRGPANKKSDKEIPTDENQGENQKEDEASQKDEAKDGKDVVKKEEEAVVFSPYNTLVDTNRNGKMDKNEHKGRFPLGVAIKNGDAKKYRLAFYAGVDWITDAGLKFPVKQVNRTLAVDTFFWLTESPLVARIGDEDRKSRRVQITDEDRLRNLIFGVFLFPTLIGVAMAGGTVYYRRKHRYRGSES